MSIKNNIEIIKLDDMGRGIGYVDDKIIFIPNTLPREVVNIKITKETSKYYEGEVIDYLNISDKRIKPICPYYDKCGGCSLMHMSYKDSIDYKVKKLNNILKKFSNIDCDIKVIENKNIFNYRNKIELKIENNEWGYYNNKTHNFVKIYKCMLAKESINKVIENKKLFDITNGSIIIRSNYNDEILIIINSEDIVNIEIDELKSIIKLVGIVVNDNVLYGESYFIEKYKEIYFKVNYNSFFQINEYITNKLLDILKENIHGDNLLDLYCGVGFLGLSVNKKFNNIYGIEINENSIIDAIKNAKINNINNAYFMCSNSSEITNKIKNNIDTIIVDPPRTGLYGNTINDILKINASNLVYVSCNPITLARDLNILKEHYEIKKIYLLDMFSNTYHFESISVLEYK